MAAAAAVAVSAPEVAAVAGLRLVRGGREVLHVPALRVARGETWVVIGPNGAGKTALLRALALLERPAAGTIRLFGSDAAGAAPLRLRRRVVFAFQETLLLDDAVLTNVALPLRLRGVPRDEAAGRARAALALFGAEHLAARRAKRLSGGEARRVALARAFAPGPELLLLDEPFAALDAPSRELLASDLKRALRATGTTCVAVSHDRAEAIALGDHVGVLLAGRLAQAGTATEVFRAPASEEVARFIGVENLLPVRIVARDAERVRLDASGFELVASPSPVAGPAALACIRAQDVLVARQVAPGLSARNVVRCRVEALEPALAAVRVLLAGPIPLVALLTRAAVDELGLRPGAEVVAYFKSTAVHLT